jgi:hypothetical protein
MLIAWKLGTWRNFNLETTLQTTALIVFAQSMILLENLLPYRIQTALGTVSTDGHSLWQLLFSKTPDVLHPRWHLANATPIQTWTK